jgi:hypothetical protein
VASSLRSQLARLHSDNVACFISMESLPTSSSVYLYGATRYVRSQVWSPSRAVLLVVLSNTVHGGYGLKRTVNIAKYISPSAHTKHVVVLILNSDPIGDITCDTQEE